MFFEYKIVNKKKLAAVFLIDVLGLLFIKSFTLLRKKKSVEREKIKKILVVRLAYVGDVVMTTPVLRPLRRMFPYAKIFFLTGTKETEILKNNPSIDEILSYDAFWFYSIPINKAFTDYLKIIKRLRKEKFDLAIDFRGDIRNIFFILFLSRAYHRVSYGIGGGSYFLTHVVPFKKIKHKISFHLDVLKSLRIKSNTIKPEIYLSSSEKKFRKAVFKANGISKNDLVIGIHPGGRKKLKCWHLQGYIELITRLTKNSKVKIVITGSPNDIDLVDKINYAVPEKTISLCGKTSLRELASLVEGFDLFISGDSAPMHIACTLGTPVVGIFGPSKSRETGPYGNTFQLVEKDFPCRFSCDENICQHHIYNECMKAISSDDVYNAAVSLIKMRKVKT